MRARGWITLWLAIAALSVIFVFAGAGFDLDYAVPKRLTRLAAILLSGVCIAFSAITFQTLTSNRILTPAIMGYEAVYLFFQSLLLLQWGAPGMVALGSYGNFSLSLLLLLGYSWSIHRLLLRGGRSNVYHLLLLGLALTLVIGTFTMFVQLLISPGEFAVLQGLSYASFNRPQPELLVPSALLVASACLLIMKTLSVLDVLALGRDSAISLGVDHRRYVKFYLSLLAVLVSVSTSLVGPTAFTGVFVANMAYAASRSSKHRDTLPLGCAFAIGLFLVAQFLVEHAFNYKTTVSILVNLVSGAYLLSLMARSRHSA